MEHDFLWILVVDDGRGMTCSLCHKLSQHPKKAALGRAMWVDLAWQNLMKLNLVKHSQSESHSTAVMIEADLCSSRRDGGIAMAFNQPWPWSINHSTQAPSLTTIPSQF